MSEPCKTMPPHPDFHAPWSDELADWYAEFYGEHSSNRQTIEQAELEPGDHLLDIGCGSGSALREAARILNNGHFTGIDLSPGMIDIARSKTTGHPFEGRIDYAVGSADAIPFSDDSFSVVTAINSLHHWPDPVAGLREVQRVLREGGRLILCCEILEDRQNRAVLDEFEVTRILADSGFKPYARLTLATEDGEIFVIKARSSR